MPFRAVRCAAVLLSCLALLNSSVARAASPSREAQAAVFRAPLSFEPREDGAFVARGAGFGLRIARDGAALALRDKGKRDLLRVQWPGANPRTRLRAEGRLAARSHYFVGNDPRRWRRDVPNFARVRVGEVYPGIGLVFYGKQRQFEYDWIVSPGADPSRIRLRFAGAKSVSLNARGDLALQMPGGTLLQHKPLAYQNVNGARRAVAASYVVRPGGEVRLRLAKYDRRRPLVIDPVLVYSTYLGGSATEDPGDVAVDNDGNLYVVGATDSVDFPVQSALDASYNGGTLPYPGTQDAFVTKYNASGALVFSTYIGGATQQDKAYRVKVDATGSPVVAGVTGSTDFPVKNPYQAQLKGGVDAFLFKMTPDGRSLVYSTYFGGSSDEGTDLADSSDPNASSNFLLGVRLDIDGSGNVYLGGNTHSRDLPVKNAYQGALASGDDAFIAKFSTASNRLFLVYATYFGGGGFDACTGITVDAVGRVFISGYTQSDDFPQKNPVQLAFGGATDCWIAKLDYNGLNLVFSTYLGGSGVDRLFRLALDKSGNAVVAGRTDSDDFPVRNAIVSQRPGGVDMFMAKIPPLGSSLLFSTYFGGGGGDRARSLALDSQDNICVLGDTTSANLPLRLPLQNRRGGGRDLALVKLSADGSGVLSSSFFGGSAEERGLSIALDRLNNWFVLGFTASTNYPTQNAAQPNFGGGGLDACVAKISYDAFAAPPSPAKPGQIAFVSARDGNPEIYVMNDDGSNQTRLTRNSAIDDMPNFRPDGGRIVFSSRRNGNREIYVMNADGTAQARRTTNAASDYDPVFSPDGARIAFVSTRDGNPEIYVMAADGSNVQRLTDNPATDDAPAWSADGTTIAFHSNRGNNNDIYLMGAASGGLGGVARLTTHARNDHRPAWSPDGNALVFQSDREGNYQIYLMAADGLRQVRLTSTTQIDTMPCFSPDGGRVAFTSTRSGGDQEIYTMRREGDALGAVALTNNAAADYDPTWATGRVAGSSVASGATQVRAAVTLSTMDADAARGEVRLTFTGAPDAGAVDACRVTVNGAAVPVESATLGADGATLTLRLPAGALRAGDEVAVAWPGGSGATTAQ